MRSLSSKKTCLSACAALALLLPACQNSNNYSFFGYCTAPNYRSDIHTVRVKIFSNRTFNQGLEFQITQALIKEIELKTPWKVVAGNCAADTEISGTVMSFTKGNLVVNNVNEERDVETTLAVEVVWKDLRTGEILSKPPRRPGEALVETTPPVATVLPQMPPGAPGTPTPTILTPPTNPGAPTATPKGFLITTTADYIPELGSSVSTSTQQNINKLVRNIVELMETPW